MKNAVTCRELTLSLGEVLSFNRLELTQRPGEHGKLVLSAVLNSDRLDETFYELPENITVQYKEDETEKNLFQGVITDSSMKRTGNLLELELKAYDGTWILDTKKKTRSFQNLSRTNHSVIAEIMEGYPESECMKNLPEEEIGRIWFQYEETDWEFLKRFLSYWKDSLYADAAWSAAKFQAGLSPVDIDAEWDRLPYCMGKDLERYANMMQNGFADLLPQHFLEYSLESYELYPLGSRMTFHGAQWYIGGLRRELKEGLLVNTYELRQKKGLLVIPEYNHRITGISVDGQAMDINRDKVRVRINGDLTEEQRTYWFPFSTVASSGDGSGWYSMPEKGDSIRVYFPTCDEKEAYVITKHDAYIPAVNQQLTSPQTAVQTRESSSGNSHPAESGQADKSSGAGNSGDQAGAGENRTAVGAGAGNTVGDTASANAAMPSASSTASSKKENPMDDPGKRNIFTKDGCVVQLTPQGVNLTAGSAGIFLKKSGALVLDAPAGITLSAGKKIVMNGVMISMRDAGKIKLQNGKGAMIDMMKREIRMSAMEIHQNSEQ